MKKMMNKRALAIFMTLIMLLLSACSNSNEPTEAAKAPESTSPAESAPAAEESTDDGIAWPEKTVQVTVPYNAGGDTDIYCRTTVKYLEKVLGQSMIVINTSGAGGMNAAHAVMDSKPDGYSVLMRHTAQLITEATGMADLSYTEDMDIAGTAIKDNTYTLVVRKDSGFKTLDDLVKYAKANPNKLTFSNVYGSATHQVSIQMKREMGIEYKDLDVGSSSADRIAAFLGGQVDMLVANYATMKDFIDTGDFIALGIMDEERNAGIPDLPTFVEQGYNVVSQKIYTFAFPKGTDPKIVQKFSDALKVVSEDPEFQKEIKGFYGTVLYRNAQETHDLEAELVKQFAEEMSDVKQ